MKLILAGKYESAIVRAVDSEYQPIRNTISHVYYADLNRVTEKRFFDGTCTFMAIGDETYVPWWLDWNFPYPSSTMLAGELSLKRTPRDRDENDFVYAEVEKLAKEITKNKVLSRRSIRYIRTFDFTGYEEREIEEIRGELRDITLA